MKKLNLILQSKYFIFTLIFLTILYVSFITHNTYYHSKYSDNTSKITGIIYKIKIDGNKVTIHLKGKEKIIVNYYMKREEEIKIFKKYKLGDKISVFGTINLPHENTNFNLFNYRHYLLSIRIYWIFNASEIKLVKHSNNWLYKIKNITKERIDNINNPYLATFILGDSSMLNSEISNSYRLNGISHLFALSGMHVGLITTCLLWILNKLSNHKNINKTIVSIFLLFYMFMTNFSPSIVRCSLFFIILFVNNKRIKTLNLFIIFTCLMLIFTPYSIYNVAFLFSYSITLTLIFLSKYLKQFKNYILKTFIITFISFLVSIPILINSYHQISLIGLVINLFYIPFVSFILLPLSIITFICPIFKFVLDILTNFLESSSLYLAKIEYGRIILSHINVYGIIIYYSIISLVLYKISKKKYYYILIIAIILFIHSNIYFIDKDISITYLDVGQGDSTLIKLSNDKGNILIDTGGIVNYNNKKWMRKNKEYSIAIDITIPYLKSQGIKELNYLLLTHGDYDHMGEAINLVNNFKVEKVIFNCGEFNDLETELIKVLDKKKIPFYSCIKELNIDNNKLYFLQTKEYDNENDNSNVIYTEINGYKFMFMGDAGADKEKDILEKYNIRNVDVLKVGHHGSKTSSSREFINEINPKYSVISVGKNNRYGHPNKEVINNLENSQIYRTDQDGSIMFKIKNNKLEIETCSP